MYKAVNGENNAYHGLVHFPYKKCVALIQDKFIRNVEL